MVNQSVINNRWLKNNEKLEKDVSKWNDEEKNVSVIFSTDNLWFSIEEFGNDEMSISNLQYPHPIIELLKKKVNSTTFIKEVSFTLPKQKWQEILRVWDTTHNNGWILIERKKLRKEFDNWNKTSSLQLNNTDFQIYTAKELTDFFKFF